MAIHETKKKEKLKQHFFYLGKNVRRWFHRPHLSDSGFVFVAFSVNVDGLCVLSQMMSRLLLALSFRPLLTNNAVTLAPAVPQGGFSDVHVFLAFLQGRPPPFLPAAGRVTSFLRRSAEIQSFFNRQKCICLCIWAAVRQLLQALQFFTLHSNICLYPTSDFSESLCKHTVLEISPPWCYKSTFSFFPPIYQDFSFTYLFYFFGKPILRVSSIGVQKEK